MKQVVDDPIDVTEFSDHERQGLMERAATPERATLRRPLAVPACRTPAYQQVPPRRRWPALAVAAGLVLMVAAGAIFVGSRNPPVDAAEVAAETLPSIGTATTSYPPGHTSGWHVHPGVHSVVVLSGTLTVYDERCVRTEYGSGQTYLGGSEAHLARNESPDPLDVAITFVYRPSAVDHGTPVAAPGQFNLR